MKYYILLGLLTVAAAYPKVIHDEQQLEERHDFSPISESGHHHQVEHEHAKSHQSIKFEHFHPVPVYVKKEHSHLLKHPLEKGKHEASLKLIHPETQHSHGGGLVLEDDRHNTDHHAAAVEHGDFHHGGFEQEHGGFEQELGGNEHGHGGYEHGHGGFEQQSGGYEGYGGSDGLKGYAITQEQEGEFDGGKGYKYDSY